MKRSRSQSPAQMLRYASVIVREMAQSSSDNQEENFNEGGVVDCEVKKEAINSTLQKKSKKKRLSSGGGGVLILDVRTRDEFKRGHLQNAVHIKTKPLSTLSNTSNETTTFGTDQKQHLFKKLQRKIAACYTPSTYIIVYCSDGERAGIAKMFLDTLGFRNVICLGGLDIPPLDDIVAGKETDDAFQMCACTTATI